MPALTQIDIVNAMAVELGSTERVTTIEGGGALARHARACWERVTRRIAAEHPWNHLVRRAMLNAAAEAPAFGYERAFALPADCLRFLPPNPNDGENWFEAEVEGDMLATDAEAPLPIRYVSTERLAAIGRWPAWFAEAVIFALAEACAESVTGSQSIRGTMQDKAEEALRKAKRRDALESGTPVRRAVTARSDWLTAMQQPYNYWGR
jgi:hypothetical protein